jgi:glycosidase
MKIVIYQLLVRLFGNKCPNGAFYGSIRDNGCGKFNDIDSATLRELRLTGITHVWYTGVLEHATMTDYSVFGISRDDPDVVKGRAGSPYAVKDCYDVDPDLASSPPARMREFEALVERTREAGLKTIIDFVPNHVARACKSDVKPKGVKDLGEDDNTAVAFDPRNNFYYIPGERFQVPRGYNPGGDSFVHPLKDNNFPEYPAKASGNDVFSAAPSIDDWFETVKLNYGVDPRTGKKHFDPLPDTWLKMRDILLFWAGKGIDGFRCDMCEMVPPEFWDFAVREVKRIYPEIIFIGEAYSPSNYRRYLSAGFDYLYDKAGLYDLLRAVVEGRAGIDSLADYLESEVKGIEQHLIAFLENHDEQRFASRHFAGNPMRAIAPMTLAATLRTSPVMIYFGQELGAAAEGATGFSGDDGRTSIFDYTCVPEIQSWINNGKFDGAALTDKQRDLRAFYVRLLRLCNESDAIARGKFASLAPHNATSPGFNPARNYAFLRYTATDRLIVFVTTDEINPPDLRIRIPDELFAAIGLSDNADYVLTDILFDSFRATVGGVELRAEGVRISGVKHKALILAVSD